MMLRRVFGKSREGRGEPIPVALHRELEIPPADLLIHAGDFTFSFEKHLSMYEDFNNWLGELPHRYKVVVPAIEAIDWGRLRNPQAPIASTDVSPQ